MRRTLRVLLLVVLFCGGVLAAPSATSAKPKHTPPPTWTPRPEQYGVVRVDNVPIVMSDGVQLLADVHYPADTVTGLRAPGTFPVILAMTPYRKRGSLTVGSSAHPYGGDGYFPYLVKRGYINVIVDVRGTGSSGGQWDIQSEREMTDGVELVHWASKQLSGSNGVVGMGGFSYLGINQLGTAGRMGPNSPLKAIFPVVASHDGYRDLLAPGGMFASGFMPQWFGLEASYIMSPNDDASTDPVGAVTEEINRSSAAAYIASWAAEMAAGGPRSYSNEFHQSRAPRVLLDEIVANKIPAFLVGGWFDLFQRGMLLNYSGLQNAFAGRPVLGPMKPGQPVSGNYQMVVGPWYHLETLEPPVLADLNNLMLRWYDRWLKGIRNGVEVTKTPVHLYELRSQRWVDTATFPFTQTVTRQFFGADGTLSAAAPAPGSNTMAWEPSAGYCTRSMDAGNAGLIERYRYLGYQNPCTQDDTPSQVGRLTYTSAPLTAAKVLAGPITATIHATSTAPEVLLVATVEVVSQDGASYPVSTGELIGSFRAVDESQTWRDRNGLPVIPYHPFSADTQAPVEPGVATEYLVEIPSTFVRLDAGDRLRVTLTPSDEPKATPTAPQLAALTGGVYEILSGGSAPSVIDVPLVDPALFPNSTFAWGTGTE